MAWGSPYCPDFRVAVTTGGASGTTALNDRRICEVVTGTPTITADSIDVGRYALSCDATAAATSITLSSMQSGGTQMGAIGRFKVNGSGANMIILTLSGSPTTDQIRLRYNNGNSLLEYTLNGGTSWVSSGFTLTVGRVYRCDAFVDWGAGTTHTFKLRIDGTEIVNTTGGTVATVNGTGVLFGSSATFSNTVFWSDMCTYTSSAEYGTLRDWRVWSLSPNALGTSSFTDNDFQNAASTNITAANIASLGIPAMLDEFPPTTTDFIKQVVIRTTGQIEVGYPALDATLFNPKLVAVAFAMHPVAAATANSSQVRLRDADAGNVSTEAAIDASIAADTLEYRKHHYPTRPVSGSAWTLQGINALKTQFGFSGDATPPPALDAVQVWVLAEVQSQAPRKPVFRPSQIAAIQRSRW